MVGGGGGGIGEAPSRFPCSSPPEPPEKIRRRGAGGPKASGRRLDRARGSLLLGQGMCWEEGLGGEVRYCLPLDSAAFSAPRQSFGESLPLPRQTVVPKVSFRIWRTNPKNG